jgi:hypothetical protein
MCNRCRPLGWLLVAVLALTGCSTPTDPSAAAVRETPDPVLTADVLETFSTYRTGVLQGDPEAVLASLDDASLDEMARVADLARVADESTVRALPAADQLIVLTYRLRPELLEADDPYAAFVEARFGGQDRSLGDIGAVSGATDDVALGVVVDPSTREPTPLRWRFRLQDDSWRFDLRDAHRLVSQAIANSARRQGVGVDDLVAATVVDLSGEPEGRVEALYTEPPAVTAPGS